MDGYEAGQNLLACTRLNTPVISPQACLTCFKDFHLINQSRGVHVSEILNYVQDSVTQFLCRDDASPAHSMLTHTHTHTHTHTISPLNIQLLELSIDVYLLQDEVWCSMNELSWSTLCKITTVYHITEDYNSEPTFLWYFILHILLPSELSSEWPVLSPVRQQAHFSTCLCSAVVSSRGTQLSRSELLCWLIIQWANYVICALRVQEIVNYWYYVLAGVITSFHPSAQQMQILHRRKCQGLSYPVKQTHGDESRLTKFNRCT